ncbi:CdaR family protein [Anaerotalea alkaliphila]|uniref:YbbR domain-containing protein n=1 Tax=Anaerotalea alkaliphila TaxID=2662126 RepID=A0A7X5KLU1_9FIRM|nr:CdaR family protein [Anaerotalea alkaliphila]NDL67201.1 hypothetical protein [Anaerotalea alkaliphila]
MLDNIMDNIGWKLLSVLLGFVLWLTVVNYEDPLVTRTFNNVPVNKLNESVITSQRKSIEYVSGDRVDIKIRGKRSLVDRMSYNDIYVYADLSKMSITGAVEIQVQVDNDIKVMEKEPGTMQVELENVLTIQKEIQHVFKDDPAAGYIALNPSIEPNSVQITGPQSKIALVKRVLVPVSISGATKEVTFYGNLQVMGEDGQEILGLTPSINQVKVVVPIEKTKRIDIQVPVTGQVAAGHVLAGVSYEPRTITVRGKEGVVDEVSSITLEPISVQGLTEDKVVEVDLVPLLPRSVFLYDEAETVKVTLDVEALVQRDLILQPREVQNQGLAEGLTLTHVAQGAYSLRLSGTQEALGGLTVSALRPSISLANLGAGTHTVQLVLDLPEGVSLVAQPLRMQVVLEAEGPVTEPEEEQ